MTAKKAMTDAGIPMGLKPCPFCGNDGDGPIEEALHVSMAEHDWRDPSWTVQCDKCTATMGYSDSEDKAVEAWNTRAIADTPPPAAAGDRSLAREAIARIVDPNAWTYRDAIAQQRDYFEKDLQPCWPGFSFEQWRDRGVGGSLAKADAILALRTPEPNGGGEVDHG